MREKKSLTKEKIKKTAIALFNEGDTLSISTNHIAAAANISPGNLYYHYKNKEAIIKEIYLDMSQTFEELHSFEKILSAQNPLQVLADMFDLYGKLFWEYRFLMRDMITLMAVNPELKKLFIKKQNLRITQIESVLQYLIDKKILKNIQKEEIHLHAKLNWFISAYWQTFTSTNGTITKDSIKQSKEIVFNIILFPYLTKKGKELFNSL